MLFGQLWITNATPAHPRGFVRNFITPENAENTAQCQGAQLFSMMIIAICVQLTLTWPEKGADFTHQKGCLDTFGHMMQCNLDIFCSIIGFSLFLQPKQQPSWTGVKTTACQCYPLFVYLFCKTEITWFSSLSLNPPCRDMPGHLERDESSLSFQLKGDNDSFNKDTR